MNPAIFLPYRTWWKVQLSEDLETQAKIIRVERDKRYGNIFAIKPTDERWVGDLGEIVFDLYLKSRNIEDYTWIKEDTARKPDFIIFGQRIELKTAKRQVIPQPFYEGGVQESHVNESKDYFFFNSYEYLKKVMWLVGGIGFQRFKELSTYCPEGTEVHKGFVIRKGAELFNIEFSHLISPDEWLQLLERWHP